MEGNYGLISKGAIVYALNDAGNAGNDKEKKSSGVSAIETPKKTRPRVLDETKFSFGAFARRSDFRAHSTLYTEDGSQGVAGAYFGLRDRGNFFIFQYKHPEFSGKKHSADDYSAAGGFSSFLDRPNNIMLAGRAEFHYLKDAKDSGLSSYASAKLSLRAGSAFAVPELSFEKKYYLDDYGGDRDRNGDYTASAKVMPLRDILPDIFKTAFSLNYASEKYLERKSTPRKEGRRGFRDFVSELYMDEKFLLAGVSWSHVIDDDWKRVTGANQLDCYFALKIDLDELKITLRYDYLRQKDSEILKKGKKHLAEAEAVFTF
jgi:hypothetical protein